MERRDAYLRSLAVAAGIGVVSALLLIPVSAYAVTIAPDAPLLYAPIVGLWALPVLTSMLALRRPGVGMVTALVAGVLNLPLGAYGARALLSVVAVALILELAVGAAGYRRWRKSYFAIVLAVAVLLLAGLAWRGLGLDRAGMPVQLAFVALELISVQGAVVLAGVLSRLIEHSPAGRWAVARGAAARSRQVAGGDGWQYDGGLAKKPDTTP